MNNLGLYFLCFLVPMIIGFAVQGWLKRTFAKNSQVPVQSGMTGAEVARRILDSNGLQGVPIHPSKAGPLSDHYDPRKKELALSEVVYSGRSVGATAVAAHEVGHAIQHSTSYFPMKLRSAIWPVAALGSQMWYFLLIAGLILQVFGLIQIALIVFALVIAFQLITLPVEFNASRRALAQVKQLGLVTEGEGVGARQTLTAAAMTYVAGALASIAQLMYFLAMFGGRR